MLKQELTPFYEKFESLENLLREKQAANKEFRKKVKYLKDKCFKKDEQIEKLNQYSRRNNVILDGVPKKDTLKCFHCLI